MIFALVVFASAFLIEAIGTYVSILGLASLFSASPVIITLAVALDIGKIVSVSFVYKYWGKINVLMKTYMSVAAVILMIITSAGCFAFLSSEFQKAISNTNTNNVVLQALTEEKDRLQNRKQEIDRQISNLPEKYTANQRIRVTNQFKEEQKQVTSRLAEIDKQLPSLKIDTIKKNVEVGPIIYIAEVFNTTPEKAVKWVILTIIFVFDPLAIALLLAGNFLIENLGKKKPKYTLKELLADYDPDKHGRPNEFGEYFDAPTSSDRFPNDTNSQSTEKTINKSVTIVEGDRRRDNQTFPSDNAEGFNPPMWIPQAAHKVEEKQETQNNTEIQQPVKMEIPRDEAAVISSKEPLDEEKISIPKEDMPLAKSSLGNIDPRAGDVIFNDGGGESNLQLNSLKSMYSTDALKDGGIPGRQLRR